MYRGSLVNLLFIIEVLLKKNSHTSWRILKNSFGQVLSLYWFEWIGEGKWYKKSKKSYHHWFLHLVDIWNFCITLCATAAFSSNFIDGWHRFWVLFFKFGIVFQLQKYEKNNFWRKMLWKTLHGVRVAKKETTLFQNFWQQIVILTILLIKNLCSNLACRCNSECVSCRTIRVYIRYSASALRHLAKLMPLLLLSMIVSELQMLLIVVYIDSPFLPSFFLAIISPRKSFFLSQKKVSNFLDFAKYLIWNQSCLK